MNRYENNFGFGASLDDIVNAAREFGERMKGMAPDFGPFWFDPAFGCGGKRDDGPSLYFYPPTNSYKKEDGSIVFEFALPGYAESDISISFQGDFLILDAKAPRREEGSAEGGWRRGFGTRNIDKQKYRVPAEDYVQDEAKAVFKNGVLAVTVPAKESAPGIKIEIVKEGN